MIIIYSLLVYCDGYKGFGNVLFTTGRHTANKRPRVSKSRGLRNYIVFYRSAIIR